MQKCQSNLAFDLVTPCKLTRKEQKSYAYAHLLPNVPEMENIYFTAGGRGVGGGISIFEDVSK